MKQNGRSSDGIVILTHRQHKSSLSIEQKLSLKVLTFVIIGKIFSVEEKKMSQFHIFLFQSYFIGLELLRMQSN